MMLAPTPFLIQTEEIQMEEIQMEKLPTKTTVVAEQPKPKTSSVIKSFIVNNIHFVIGLSIFLVLFLVTASFSIIQSQASQQKAPRGLLSPQWYDTDVGYCLDGGACGFPADERAEKLQLEIIFGELKAATNQIILNVHFEFGDKYLNYQTTPVTIIGAITMELNSEIKTMKGTASGDFIFTMNLDSGSLSQYPADVYQFYLKIYSTYIPEGGTNADAESLDFILKVEKSDTGAYSHSQKFLPFYVNSTDWTGLTYPTLAVTFNRPMISYFYPVLMVIMFWSINVGAWLYYMPFILGSAKVGLPSPLVFSSLMFAVPSIRNSMPGLVPIGSVIDFFGFYWAILNCTFLFLHSSFFFFKDNRLWTRPSAIPTTEQMIGHWMGKKNGPIPRTSNGFVITEDLIEFWKRSNKMNPFFCLRIFILISIILSLLIRYFINQSIY